MENTAKVGVLKEARLKFLQLHKLLIDIERSDFERLNGKVTSGQFLNLLVNDRNFVWLRKFSLLIVEIDELMDLDDGYTEAMIENKLSQMRELLSMQSDDQIFNEKYNELLSADADVAGKHNELKEMLFIQ